MRHNLRRPLALARAAAPHPPRSGSGRIVNVAAMAGLRPLGASIVQSVSKAGVIQLTRCLALALAPDVSVNCVAPGLMEGTEDAQPVRCLPRRIHLSGRAGRHDFACGCRHTGRPVLRGRYYHRPDPRDRRRNPLSLKGNPMPSMDIQVPEEVLCSDEKAEIIKSLTRAIGSVAGDALATGATVRIHEIASGSSGHAGQALTPSDARAMRHSG